MNVGFDGFVAKPILMQLRLLKENKERMIRLRIKRAWALLKYYFNQNHFWIIFHSIHSVSLKSRYLIAFQTEVAFLYFSRKMGFLRIHFYTLINQLKTFLPNCPKFTRGKVLYYCSNKPAVLFLKAFDCLSTASKVSFVFALVRNKSFRISIVEF